MKRMAGGGQGKKAQAKISHPNRALSDVNLSDTASSSSSEQQPVAGPSSRRREVESESDSDSDSDVEVIVTKKPAQAAVSGKRARHEDTSIDSTEEEPPPPRKRPKPKPIPKTRPRKPNNTLNPRAAGRNPSEDATTADSEGKPFITAQLNPAQLQDALDKANLEKRALTSSLEQAQVALDSSRKQTDKQSQRITVLRDSRAKVHSDNHILQLKLDASRREHSSLEDELRKTEEQLRTVQAEVEALQSNHVLEAQVDALQKEIAKSQRKHAAANTEVQRLLGVQFTERNKSRENEAKIEGLIQENERLSRELHSQKTDADTERSKGQRKQNEADMTIKKLKLELVQHKALLQQQQSKPLQASNGNTSKVGSKRPKPVKESSEPESSEDEQPPAKRRQLVSVAAESTEPAFVAPAPQSSTSATVSTSSTTVQAESSAATVSEAAVPTVAVNRDDAGRRATAGQIAHKQGAFMMASRLYTEALALGLESEMHLKVLYNRASANYECEKSKASFIELVQADCRELLSKKKDHFKAQRILARTERIRKNYGDAIKWYQTALAVFGSTSGVPAQFKSETEVELKQLKDEQKHDEEASRQAQAREEEREYARFRHLDDWSFIGVKRSANQDTIKTAIRKMWLKYHPDRGAGSNKLMMQRINAVKERLLGNQAHIRGVPSM